MVYQLEVEWVVRALVDVEAATFEDAAEMTMHIDLPEGDYVDNSFKVLSTKGDFWY